MEQRIKEHLTHLGCTNPTQISIAFQVFITLLDVKLMHDVEIYYNKDTKLPYLSAKSSKNADPHIFVPYSTFNPINMKYIEKIQNALCKNGQMITLACVEGDSTVVFYTFSKKLINPDNPEYFIRQKIKEERKDYLESEIRKNSKALLMKSNEKSVKE